MCCMTEKHLWVWGKQLLVLILIKKTTKDITFTSQDFDYTISALLELFETSLKLFWHWWLSEFITDIHNAL